MPTPTPTPRPAFTSSASAAARPANALTIDVEDYFQVSAFAPYIARSEWDTRECHVERNVERILELLATRGIHATFFTLGWIAERYPAMVRRIAQQGHELASHGYGHERATTQTPQAFFADVQLAKILLEDLVGSPVLGYRAPSFSIDARNPWAFDMLLRAGYRYSSSIYPIAHDHYGMPQAPRFAFEPCSGLLEIPITTLRLLGRNFPSSGGGYFRLLPYALSHWMLQHVNAVDRQACIFYFHPWELDTQQPPVDGINARTRFRHYLNLGRMQQRLENLFDDFRWDRVDQVFLKGDPPRAPVH
jgi:polysaccharide deacetylase family protein (PEP-CTERM system associated)